MKTRNLAFALTIALAATSCSRQPPLARVCQDEASAQQWNKDVIVSWRRQHYADVVTAFETSPGCIRDTSWQTLFSAGLAIAVTEPGGAMKGRLLALIDRFETRPTWIADPGPLLVAMGEDQRALRWYRMSRALAVQDAAHDVNARSVSRFAGKAVALIEDASWAGLETQAKLERLVAIMKAQ